jgi:hypothetical protein
VIKIQVPKANGKDTQMTVSFTIQYLKNQGSQRGKIVILAKGADAWVGYPNGVLPSGAMSETQIRPDRGEPFSVSRFREVRAEIKGIANLEGIREVQVMIYGSNKKILLQQSIIPKIEVAAPPAPAAPASASEEGTPSP